MSVSVPFKIKEERLGRKHTWNFASMGEKTVWIPMSIAKWLLLTTNTHT